MMTDFGQLFNYLPAPELPARLLSDILARIARKRRMTAIRNSALIFCFGFVGSLFAFFPAWQALRADIIQSGFYDFLSLILSDSSVVLNYWNIFARALLETLPIVSAAMLLGVLFIFFGSLKYFIHYIKIILSPYTPTSVLPLIGGGNGI